MASRSFLLGRLASVSETPDQQNSGSGKKCISEGILCILLQHNRSDGQVAIQSTILKAPKKTEEHAIAQIKALSLHDPLWLRTCSARYDTFWLKLHKNRDYNAYYQTHLNDSGFSKHYESQAAMRDQQVAKIMSYRLIGGCKALSMCHITCQIIGGRNNNKHSDRSGPLC
eukprot:scaffold59515_cov18-Prasinocladus_malaysianus.AAC.1